MTTFSVGGPITPPDVFNEARWRQVGATDEQVAILHAEFEALDEDARLAANRLLASKPNGEVAALLPATAPSAVETPAPPATPGSTKASTEKASDEA